MQSAASASSSVVRYVPVIRASTVIVEDAGYDIVGAGASPRAPHEPAS